MKKLLIVYHSQTGNTLRLARAALDGARREAGEVETRLLHARDAGLDELLECNALLLGTPENFGLPSGMIKDFLDRTFYPAQNRRADAVPYALFVSAGNDGTGAVRQIERIARGYPWKRVADPVVARGDLTEADLEAARELGHTMAAGLAFGVF
ncbi:MAG: NAD(P)H-dependent oxidoreductase [Myxococcales bacterium]|nr:NAD(P)H-dependent oxidoreductase [Myxococcales bacterium]